MNLDPPRHIAVDTLGLPVRCYVTTADVQDRDALPSAAERRQQACTVGETDLRRAGRHSLSHSACGSRE